MRYKRFITEHRGGLLTKEQHRQLIFWACKCAENVLPLFTNTIEIAVARSIGHAAATAHMADHSLRAAEYALKAIKLADKSIEIERKFQDKNAPFFLKTWRKPGVK